MSKPLAFVIEDNADLALVYAAAVRAAGFEVETIVNGARAIDRLAEVQPSLVVLDLNLPLVPGESTLRQVTNDVRLLNTRVMIVTADASRAELLRDKADLVLTKPVMFTQLRDLAQRLVPAAKRFAETGSPDTPVDSPAETGSPDTPDDPPAKTGSPDTPDHPPAPS